MDKEFLKQLEDYFEAHELVELLGISVEDIIVSFREEIRDNVKELKEFMNYGD